MSRIDIPHETVDAFRHDGVAVVRGAFAEWVEQLRAGVDRNLEAPGPFARHYTPAGEPGHFFGDYCNWARIPEYRAFVHDSPVGEVGAALMGARQVRFFHEHVLVKEPGTRERTPWHHDAPYYSVSARQTCSLWIPLDEVSRSACPEFVRGSHQWGKWYVPTRFTGQSWDRKQAEETALEQVPDIEAERDRYDIVAFDLAPGDALAFSFLTVHGAPPNLSGTHRRRGFSARLLGDEATWAVRSGTTSPPFPELSGKLTDGESLEGVDAFPLIWREGQSLGAPPAA